MAEGLSALLENMRANQGMAGGWKAGQERSAAYDQSLANLTQRQQENSRYAAETPGFLERQDLDNESKRLGNLPGQGMEQADAYNQAGNAAAATSKVSAEEARAKFDRLPYESQKKMTDSIKEAHLGMLDLVSNTLRQTNDVGKTIQILESKYPDLTKDASWNEQKSSVMGLTPQDAIGKVNLTREQIAFTDYLSSMKGQGEMIKQDQQDAAAMDRTKYSADAGIQSARIGADSRAATSGGSTNSTEALLTLMQQLETETDPERQKMILWKINTLSKSKEQTSDTLLGPSTKETALTMPPNMKPKETPNQIGYRQYKAAWDRATTEEQKRELTKMARERGFVK